MKKIIILLALIINTTLVLAAGSDNDGNGTNSTTGNTVLSITLTNFKGNVSDQLVVDLSWSTMMEKDVDHFDIMRSGDGMNFEKIDSVGSKMKITTNDYQLLYSYTDVHPLGGITYYKIKVVGRNGSVNQSPVIQINNVKMVDGVKLYPTLIQNNIIIIESGKTLREARLEIFDMSGKKISETNWSILNGRENASVSKSGSMQSGTYVARLTASGQSIKTQLIIVQSH